MSRHALSNPLAPPLILFLLITGPTLAAPMEATEHLGFETESDVLRDFVSMSEKYRTLGVEGLAARSLVIGEGRFGNALHIRDGWPVSKGTWNESGLDCDLTVAVMWGEWHTKPHYWGSGKFHGEEGTVAFWVRKDHLHPGVILMQGSIAWGRMERDLFTVEVDDTGRFSAHIRDVANRYHRVRANEPTWRDGEWQHVAVAYDHAFGLRIYHNGTLAGSTWGEDAWWQTPLPGLFSPFLPESAYDEICFFDEALGDAQIQELYTSNTVTSLPAEEAPLPDNARERLLATYGDLAAQDLPTVRADAEALHLKQTRVKSCVDDQIPAGWIMDGRYELAWPHPYRLFTFVLGDADFHGTKADIVLEPGEKPNYIAFEGMLDELKLVAGKGEAFERGKTLAALGEDQPFYYSKRIELGDTTALRLPFTKRFGSPPDLEGSAHLPLSGPTRVHEVHLWEAAQEPLSTHTTDDTVTWYLGTSEEPIARYGNAIQKLMSHRNRTALQGSSSPSEPERVALYPLQSLHLFGAVPQSEVAVDAVTVRLNLLPVEATDFLRLRLRDPGNPSRIWAQSWVRVEFPDVTAPRIVEVVLDIVDLLLASDDRLWIEVTAVRGGELIIGDTNAPSTIRAHLARDHPAALAAYTAHALLPGRLQYIKEYNYRPWRFDGESMSVLHWSNFGGPYDMAYAPLAALRHAPHDPAARIYKTLAIDRAWAGSLNADDIRSDSPTSDAPANAPLWAVWERELYRLNARIAHWIISQQRADGMFWGGSNDDCFIPLGFAGLPLLGDEKARRSWLRYYEGLEEMGIFHDGYCDIWPIDPLHITDFIGSRGLMLSYALGDPYVLERELRTAQRYSAKVADTDARRAANGLPPLSGDASERERNGASLVEQVEAEIRNYSLTHIQSYWGQTDRLDAYHLADRDALTQAMMEAVQQTDEAAVFALSEARIHTDNQRGAGRDALIAAALGGRVQGRVEPYPIGIAVSWEGVDTPDLARLVSDADEKRLTVELYNFANKAMKAQMRVWRLMKGQYAMSLAPVNREAGTAPPLSKALDLRRFSTIPLRIPPKEHLILHIEQLESYPREESLPDLALGPRDITMENGGKLWVTVHNLGTAPARDIEVSIVDGSGGIVKSLRVDALGAASADLSAQRTMLRFDGIKKLHGMHVVVDPQGLVEEIFEGNNRVGLG